MTDASLLVAMVLKVAMVSLRMGALWMFFPIFSHGGIPVPVRVAGTLSLSAAMLPLVGHTLPTWGVVHPPQLAELVAFVVREFAFGAGMGLTAKWIFSTAIGAAEWVGHQMGFSAGSMMDPTFETHTTSWSEFHNWLAIMLFFSVGGHWWMIESLASSYRVDITEIFARLSDTQAGLTYWAEVGHQFFIWMLKLAGPMTVVLLLLQASLGILSRFIPQINIWSVSLPITLGLGVLVFSMLSPMYGNALQHMFTATKELDQLWVRYVGAR